MDISVHIGQLVLEHECVIIPGLGAFITNYNAAEINSHHHRIQPPSRNLVFNAQLNTNDGLLAHHLSQRLNLSYKTSLLLLEVFSKYCQRDLAQGKQIAFGDLGLLDRNSFNKLEFYPNTRINYNEDAFGLKPLAINAIERKLDFSLQAPVQKKEIKLASTKVIKLNASALRKVAAVLIPLALLVSVLFYLPTLVKNENLQQTSVFSFLDSLRSDLFFDEDFDETTIPLVAENEDQSLVETELSETKDEILLEEDKLESSDLNTEIIVQETVEIPQGQFHIICGSFNEKDRAEALVDQLKADGFAASIVGQSKYGTYRVSIQSYSNIEDANNQINWVRSQGFDKAWVLNKTF